MQVTILWSNDWNALLPEVPPAGEEPPPPDGNPHPQFGPDLTAEQLYQQQVHDWLVQNAAPPNAAPAGQSPGQAQANAGWGEWPAPPAPPLPPFLVNYQAWLTAQGLSVQDGMAPENNIIDSAAQAWNDSIMVSDDTSSVHSALAIVPLEMHDPAPVGPDVAEDLLTVSVELNNQGMRFGLSAQGEALMSLLLSDPIPRQQLNIVLFSALRPLLATIGLWNNGYGMM